MHLGRFNSLISNLNSEHTDSGIEGKIQSLINKLQAVIGNPSNVDIANQFKAELDSLNNSLSESKFNTLRPIEKMMLDSINASPFIGNNLYEKILQLIKDNQISPALAIDNLTKLQKEVQDFYKNLSSMCDIFKKLGVEYDDIEQGSAEIGLLLPRQENNSTLLAFSKELKDWDKILSPINRVFGNNVTPIKIRNCATTDWTIYLCAAAGTTYGVYLCLSNVNKILSEAIKTRSLLTQLFSKNISEEIKEKLKTEVDTSVKDELRKEAEKLVDENYKGNDSGEKNELKTNLSQALTMLSIKISSGAKVEVKMLPFEDENEPNGENSSSTSENQTFLNNARLIDNNIEQLTLQDNLEDVKALITFEEPEDI